MTTLAAEFQVSTRAVSRLWKKAKQQQVERTPINVKSLIEGNSGKKRISCPFEQISNVPLSLRSTISKLSEAIGYNRSTVQMWIQRGDLKSHTSALHPNLTQDNKFLRLHFVMSKLYFDRNLRCLKFKDMSNIVHIAEKWFNLTNLNQKYYLAREEETPYRSCKRKRFIVKVMFLTVVSRPIYDQDGNVLFDGKIGIFPFTYKSPTKRNSKNRQAETMETKPIKSVNKLVIKNFMINKIIPVIKNKWSESATKNITIQQDNAKPYIHGNDPEFVQAASSDGFNIELKQQPANSPDLNVLDLVFFRSIQSLQSSKQSKTTDELVGNVKKAYENQKADILNDVWLSLQACMIEIMKRRGHNDYKLPHLKKWAARRAGTLEIDLIVDDSLVWECMEYLIEVAKDTNLEDIKADLGIQLADL